MLPLLKFFKNRFCQSLQLCLSSECFSCAALFHFLSEMSNPQGVHLLSVKTAPYPGILNILLFCNLISDGEAPRPLGLEFPAAWLWASGALAHMKYRVWGLGVHPCTCRMGDISDPWVWGTVCFCLCVCPEGGLCSSSS